MVVHRRLRHLELPQRRQPAEGAALPDRVGRGTARDGRPGPGAPPAGARAADRGTRPDQPGAHRDRGGARASRRRGRRHDERRRGARRRSSTASAFPTTCSPSPTCGPLYDEPEFVVRNIWRQFGGWWDGAPSRLKPAPDAALATELAELAGGADALIDRAMQLCDDGDLRLACHLADLAGWAAPDGPRRARTAGGDLPLPQGSGEFAHGQGHLRRCRS